MYLRTILAVALIFMAFTSSAQDRIYLRKKGMMEVKIMYVSAGRIVYRNMDDLAGKDRGIDWDDVHKVEYENGKVDFRHPIPEPHLEPMVFDGRDIFSVSPINIGDEGAGIGLAYERMLDKDYFFGLILPVNLVYASTENARAFTEDPLARNCSIFQFMPGLKFYPTGNKGRVRYAIGPQLVFEAGNKWTARPQKTGSGTEYFILSHHTVQNMGIMLNNSFNTYPSPKYFMGFDMGMGATFSHRLSGKESGARFLYQFNFWLGYRH